MRRHREDSAGILLNSESKAKAVNCLACILEEQICYSQRRPVAPAARLLGAPLRPPQTPCLMSKRCGAAM